MACMKKKTRRLFLRIIAILVVVSMIPGIVVFQQTGISLDATLAANRSVRLAARQLLQNDPYANRSRIERMSDFAKSLLLGTRSYEDYELAIEIAIAQARYDEALAFQEKALEIFEGSEEEAAEQYLRMGYLCVLLGEYEKAQNWLTLGIAVTPYVEAVLTRAQVRLNLGDTEGAVKDVDACYEAVGDSTALLPELVNVYEAAGAYETAAGLWTRVLENGGDTAYLLDRAYCYVELGRLEEAEADAARYLEAHPENSAIAQTMLGMGFLRAGDYARANRYFALAISGENSDPASLYYYVVLCAHLTADHARACEYGEKLIERVRRGEDPGAAQLSVEDVTGKVRVELKPVDYAQLCQLTGASHMMLGNYARAAEVLTLSLEAKEDGYVRYLRGASLLAEKRFGEALEDFTAAEQAGAEREKSRYSAGVCHMALGETEKALSDFDWVTQNGQDASLREEAALQTRRLRGEEQNEER